LSATDDRGMHWSRPLRVLVASVLAFAGSLPLASVAPSAMAVQLPGDPAAIMLFTVEQSMLDLTNADRVANGLDPLDFDPDTLEIARVRAASQLGPQALNHYDANGELAFVHLLADGQIGYQLAGENLARAEAEDASVTTRVEQALMSSPLHRKNILERKFTRVAIGSAFDGQGQITIAEVYRN
jgi:uncharacterized protein YkwD